MLEWQDDRRVEEFQARLVAEFRRLPIEERENSLAEVRQHFSELVAAGSEAGLTVDESIEYAIRQIGDPGEFAPRINAESRRIHAREWKLALVQIARLWAIQVSLSFVVVRLPRVSTYEPWASLLEYFSMSLFFAATNVLLLGRLAYRIQIALHGFRVGLVTFLVILLHLRAEGTFPSATILLTIMGLAAPLALTMLFHRFWVSRSDRERRWLKRIR